MQAKKQKQNEELSMEEAFEAIDLKIETLENEETKLEDAFKEFQAGMELVKYCEDAIEKMEQKVKLITEDGETEDFE